VNRLRAQTIVKPPATAGHRRAGPRQVLAMTSPLPLPLPLPATSPDRSIEMLIVLF
jgi:hypothetical protein